MSITLRLTGSFTEEKPANADANPGTCKLQNQIAGLHSHCFRQDSLSSFRASSAGTERVAWKQASYSTQEECSAELALKTAAQVPA